MTAAPSRMNTRCSADRSAKGYAPPPAVFAPGPWRLTKMPAPWITPSDRMNCQDDQAPHIVPIEVEALPVEQPLVEKVPDGSPLRAMLGGSAVNGGTLREIARQAKDQGRRSSLGACRRARSSAAAQVGRSFVRAATTCRSTALASRSL